MRTSKWIFTAALLVSVSAAAQQPSDSQASAQPNGTAPGQTVQPAASSDATQSAPSAAPSTSQDQSQPQASAGTTLPVTPSALPAPTTMDQVVDRFIEREHGLMKALATRTPVVETYLQNLTADPQLGPVPSGDHYFLGRLDMGETVDRKDYLKEQDKGMQSHRGGFNGDLGVSCLSSRGALRFFMFANRFYGLKN